ncbi:signal transduction histidine kinase [Streptomyces phaeochromogenes]|uniref:sensor histidine kinase n=1 Tax=Streptomyces phaeochromogenes TaxID=1923 RepID=UPI002794C24B|nr:sensor histidine kinase [Streptomyces phaeochromogenes]MDQ0947494.1 signal transduction histidine kinase [Streptomyces phaeochromogenes]
MTTFDGLVERARSLPPLTTDLLVVAMVGLFTAPDAASNDPDYQQADGLTWLLLAVSLLALVWRRRWPVPVAIVTGAACAGWALHGHIGELLNLPVIVALYTVAVLGDRRRTLWTGLVASLVSGAVALRVGRDVANPQGLPMLEMIWPLVPLLLGEVIRTRRQLMDEYAARAVRAEEEREREAARRVHEERLRIARELHDIVAHTVTAMTVQAGVALDALDTRPEVSRQAMRQVRDSGKEAVGELRATVTVLRDHDRDSTAPAPGLAQLPELVGRFSDSGVDSVLRHDGTADGLSPMVELAAYRIVQEALTNVVKHSGARHAAVSVARHDDRLCVEIVDDGPPSQIGPPSEAEPPSRPATGGFGLVGMRERAAAVGGSVEYGPVSGGGFRVRASLPVVLPAGALRGGRP